MNQLESLDHNWSKASREQGPPAAGSGSGRPGISNSSGDGEAKARDHAHHIATSGGDVIHQAAAYM